jgi:hypothetical protein
MRKWPLNRHMKIFKYSYMCNSRQGSTRLVSANCSQQQLKRWLWFLIGARGRKGRPGKEGRIGPMGPQVAAHSACIMTS